MPKFLPVPGPRRVVRVGGGADGVDQTADLGTDAQTDGEYRLYLGPQPLGGHEHGDEMGDLLAALPAGAESFSLVAEAVGAGGADLGGQAHEDEAHADGLFPGAELGGQAQVGPAVTSVATAKALPFGAASRDGSANNPGDWENPTNATGNGRFSNSRIRGEQTGVSAPVNMDDTLTLSAYGVPAEHPEGFVLEGVELHLRHGWELSRAPLSGSTALISAEVSNGEGVFTLTHADGDGPIGDYVYPLNPAAFASSPSGGGGGLELELFARSTISNLSGDSFQWLVYVAAFVYTYRRDVYA